MSMVNLLNLKRVTCMVGRYSVLRQWTMSYKQIIKYNSTLAQEQTADVDGCKINYVKVGSGPHHLLFTPGALGSIWTDFGPQVEQFDRAKFTVIVWDPPGYGKSRPPDREFPSDFYSVDANWALKLMETLKISKYSMLGWSNGGIASMIAAARHPERVHQLVVWGSNSFVIKAEILAYEAFRDVSMWNPALKAPLIDVYGEEYFHTLWNGWLDASIAVYHSETKGDICKKLLPLIRCPTLIMHGGKDKNIAPIHPPYLTKNIPKARLHIIEEGKHNCHIQFSEEFNKVVQNFLMEESITNKL